MEELEELIISPKLGISAQESTQKEEGAGKKKKGIRTTWDSCILVFAIEEANHSNETRSSRSRVCIDRGAKMKTESEPPRVVTSSLQSEEQITQMKEEKSAQEYISTDMSTKEMEN